MTETLPYISALIIGLLGSAHCIGMCGGISSALTLSVSIGPQFRLRQSAVLVAYQMGRITSYVIAGLLLGSAINLTALAHHEYQWIPRTIAGIFMILMGLYLSGIWHGLVKVESVGKYLWRYLEPIGKKLIPVKSPVQAIMLGLIWGWLPCGLVYSTLTLAASQTSPVQSAGVMLFFGLGTLPSVMTMGYLSQKISDIKRHRAIPILSGFAVILFGIWTLPLPWQQMLSF